MRAVGLKVLKNKLSEYVRLAAQGEVVLVTDRDRVVAELRPPDAQRSVAVGDVVLADLIRNGLVRPPLTPRGTIPPRRPVAPTEDILRELAADREDR
jgi:antitoxin (DNA-binding transcriptional repressor) of toxin-antitoxin stability system